MYLVRLSNNNEKHSIWDTKQEAIKQIDVLKSYGYRNAYYEYINANYENGHYFV